MVRKFVWAALVLSLALPAVAPPASAGTGAGIILGEPTGLSFKQYTDGNKAIDLAVAWSLEGEDALHVHGDLLFHRRDLVTVDGSGLPLYYGLGARVKLLEDDAQLGVRFPFGISTFIAGGDFDVFLELVPILDLAPDTDFSLNAGLGIRYWFD